MISLPQSFPSCTGLQSTTAANVMRSSATALQRSLGSQQCNRPLARPIGAVARDAVPIGRKRRSKLSWANKYANKHKQRLRHIDNASNGLLRQLLSLDLDSDDDSCNNARVHSHATASSSTPGWTTSRKAHGRDADRIPPSPETLVALLRRMQEQRGLLRDLDFQKPSAVARRVLRLSSHLALPPDQLVDMARRCGRLLARHPDDTRDALTSLTTTATGLVMASASSSSSSTGPSGPAPAAAGQAAAFGRSGSGRRPGGRAAASAAAAADRVRAELQAEGEALARQMASTVPELLLEDPERLQRSGLELAAVCKARGIKVLPMLSQRPDLLLQSASSLAAKMDLLPGVLGLPPRKMRDVLEACPDLLRRDPDEVANRYQLLQRLFRVPPAFMAELLDQEPRVLGFGAETLEAKFRNLAERYGRFQDDVADMILVDPAVFLNAPAEPVAPGAQSAVAAAGGGIPAADRPVAVPVLDRMAEIAAASGIPIAAVLDLVVQDVQVYEYGTEGLTARLSALGSVLGMGSETRAEEVEEEVRARVAAHPRLLTLDPEQIRGRSEALVEMLRPSSAPAAQAAGSSARQPSEAVAVAALSRHPELLLQGTEELRSRLAELTALLLGAPPASGSAPASSSPPAATASAVPARVLSLLQLHPGLLTASSDEVSNKLLVMQSLFEIPRGLVLELVFREPGLLAVSVDELERKFRALASAFGTFSGDAIDVVLADPSLVLQADQQQLSAMASASAAGAAPEGGAAAAATATATATAAADAPDLGSRGRARRRDGGGGAGGAAAGAPEDSRRRSQRRSRSGPSREAAAPAPSPAPLPLLRVGSQGLQQQGDLQAGVAGASAQVVLGAAAWAGTESGRGSSSGVSERAAGAKAGAKAGAGPRAGSAGRESGVGGGSGSERQQQGMGALGEMSAAEFDALGSTDEPPLALAARDGSGGASRANNGGSGGGSAGKPGVGRLETMSAAEFDALGSTDGSLDGKGGSGDGGGGSGKVDMGRLGTMSAAEFDRLGEEGLPPPPPPRRRRRQQ